MKTILLLSLTATLSFAAFAQTIELPRVNVPQELSSGEFAEGTITRLTAAEVAEFRPWAQNARNTLNRALTQAQSLPLRQRLPHIERAARNVVSRSGSRQYQMLMRFALNRGLLLVDELERNIDMNQIGSQENALDLILRSITVALSFYESDLTFQERAQEGDDAIIIPHARFATAFMQGMYPGVVNVLDATAQYRLLYKLIEMVNWDLSRDAHAARYAESIVEAYEMGQDLPEQPEGDDRSNLILVRRLNSLKVINLRVAATAAQAQNTNEADANTSASPRLPVRQAVEVISTPKIDNQFIAAASDINGTCIALGFESGLAGSVQGYNDVNTLAVRIAADGRPSSATVLTQWASGSNYITRITCVNRVTRARAWSIVQLNNPVESSLRYYHTSHADGVCKRQGHSRGLPGYYSYNDVNGQAAVVTLDSEIVRVEHLIQWASGSNYITRALCVREN